jgi:hypothetical protein
MGNHSAQTALVVVGSVTKNEIVGGVGFVDDLRTFTNTSALLDV